MDALLSCCSIIDYDGIKMELSVRNKEQASYISQYFEKYCLIRSVVICSIHIVRVWLGIQLHSKSEGNDIELSNNVGGVVWRSRPFTFLYLGAGEGKGLATLASTTCVIPK